MFWFKRKEIVVDCFVTNPTTHDYYPIQSANNFFPEGWKKLPKSKIVRIHADKDPESKLEVELATSKKCVGLIQLFSSGFIIPSWTDFGIEMKQDGNFMWHANSNFRVDQHPSWQVWEDFYKGYGHVKIASPWLFREEEGVKFSWHQCDWNETSKLDKFRTLSAVVDYKYQRQTNINMFVKNHSVIDFKAGEPLVHLIPLSERKVKIKTHLVTEQEFSHLDYPSSTYMNQYGSLKKIREKQEASKCPFGFKK